MFFMIQFVRGDSMLLSNDWNDYELIDCSNGEKLEKWGKVYLLRPDPQIIWDNGNLSEKYDFINAYYHRSNKGGGYWENLKKTPASWIISYKDLKFNKGSVFDKNSSQTLEANTDMGSASSGSSETSSSAISSRNNSASSPSRTNLEPQ